MHTINRWGRNTLYTCIFIILLVSSFYLTTTLLRALVPLQSVSLVSVPKPREIATVPPVRINPPSRLEIVSINVSTIVKPVSTTIDGNMAMGDNIADVAWYEPGPRPGESGSAVMAGHYGWKQGKASVFNDLHTLAVGDKVSVYDVHNNPISFIVQKIKNYNPAADATEVFQSSDGKAHLNLITCEGSWNSNLQTYTERLVVFTDLESSS